MGVFDQPRHGICAATCAALISALAFEPGCNALWGLGDLRYDASPTTAGGGQGGSGHGAQAGAPVGGAGGSAGTGASGGGGAGGAGGSSDCGNGVIEGQEECDDANVLPDDGCDECKVECGAADQVHDMTTHHCYWVTAVGTSWSVARQYCTDDGAELAAITSVAEQSLVEPLVTVDAFLGATDQVTEGVFVWVTGEPWSYTHWESGEPNDQFGEDCLLMLASNGLWNDADCLSNRAGLCERPPPEAEP